MLLSFLLGFIAIIVANLSNAQNSPVDFLFPHNAERSMTCVPDLVWDDGKATIVQNLANQRKVIANSSTPAGFSVHWYGEHLAGSFDDLNGDTAAIRWVDEKVHYDRNPTAYATGEYCGAPTILR